MAIAACTSLSFSDSVIVSSSESIFWLSTWMDFFSVSSVISLRTKLVSMWFMCFLRAYILCVFRMGYQYISLFAGAPRTRGMSAFFMSSSVLILYGFTLFSIISSKEGM